MENGVSKKISKLLDAYRATSQPRGSGLKIKVDRTMSSVSFFYEKIRNAVDYREDHLFRRSAIERILTRRITLGMRDKGRLAESLIRELIQAGYFKNDELPEEVGEDVARQVGWYLSVLNLLDPLAIKIRKKVIGVASVAIEKILVPRDKEEAMIDVFYIMLAEEFQKAGLVAGVDWNEEYLYINLHRLFLRSDEQTIDYYLLKNYLADWEEEGVGDQLVTEWSSHLNQFTNNIRAAAKDRFTSRYVKRSVASFLVIRNILESRGLTEDDLANEQDLLAAVKQAANTLYDKARTSLRRGIAKAIIFIFLTKTVFAIGLEYPYDIFIAHKANWLALGINVLFPVILLLLLGIFMKIPGSDNTFRIFEYVRQIVYDGSELLFPELLRKKAKKFPKLLAWVLYLLTFSLSCGLVLWALWLIGFNIVSGIIFFFFLSVVSFFSYRLETNIRELRISGAREGILWALGDFMALPFLKLGQVFSDGLSRVNLFLLFFDFIFEAPLKLIVEILERWAAFVRDKKEELL